jgi:hypothetical protein
MWLKTRIKKRDVCLFVIPILIFFINNKIKYNIDLPVLGQIMRYHFNDYLGGISIVAYVNLVLSLKRGQIWRLVSPLACLVFALFCSLCWELIAPVFLSDSTGDWLDVVAYCLGALTYCLFERLLGGDTQYYRRF